MSYVRDLFSPVPNTNVPLTILTPPQDQNNAIRNDIDPSHPGPSSARRTSWPTHGRTNPLPALAAPSYRDDYNSSAPRTSRTTDALLLQAHSTDEGSRSLCSIATNTPTPSRRPSPPPVYFSGASSCSSDSESEPEVDTLLLNRPRQQPPWRDSERSIWCPFSGSRNEGQARRQRRRWDTLWGYKACKRLARRLLRQPFIPKTPITIVLTLVFLTIFGVSLTYLIIYILNPDKEPLPWRGYCTLPQYSGSPPSLSIPTTAFLRTPIPTNFTLPPFPPPEFDTLAPAGVFVGVFSMDASVERRMLVRSTWAAHVRSREGAGEGDGGVGTSRTLVRFILGRPRKDYERRVQLEMDTYRDMVILPITENMNRGKTHAYFSWAAENAWIPPIYQDNFDTVPTNLTYLNASYPAPLLATHDPAQAHHDQIVNTPPQPWVRPDFVVKADDDAFVMLAELEARLRVEMYMKNLLPPFLSDSQSQFSPQLHSRQDDVPDSHRNTSSLSSSEPSYIARPHPTFAVAHPPVYPHPDPLVFWGYLVKNRFMAGELYALSYALVNWVANDPQVKTMTNGAEDKQTSKWIRAHPYAMQVRWSSQRCWIYDHPRAGTVYSHGLLFPSTVKRVQERVHRDLVQLAQQTRSESSTESYAAATGQYVPAPERWAHSTVSKWGVRYAPPYADLDLAHSVEALVEGSEMSVAYDDGSIPPDLAWKYREGRLRRYENKRVGGTVAVHFLKKNMWFLETAAAMLHGDDVTALERTLEDTKSEGESGNNHRGADSAADNSTSALAIPTNLPGRTRT